MNLYLRYFDRETLVSTVDDAIDFLRSIDEIDHYYQNRCFNDAGFQGEKSCSHS